MNAMLEPSTAHTSVQRRVEALARVGAGISVDGVARGVMRAILRLVSKALRGSARGAHFQQCCAVDASEGESDES
jgi:hypothetical protein